MRLLRSAVVVILESIVGQRDCMRFFANVFFGGGALNNKGSSLWGLSSRDPNLPVNSKRKSPLIQGLG